MSDSPEQGGKPPGDEPDDEYEYFLPGLDATETALAGVMDACNSVVIPQAVQMEAALTALSAVAEAGNLQIASLYVKRRKKLQSSAADTSPAVATPEAAQPRSQPAAATEPAQPLDLVALLRRVAEKTTIEDWAKEHGFGRTSVFDWMRNRGKPLKRKVALAMSDAIVRAILADAKELGLINCDPNS